MIGKLLGGRYKIINQIGGGGMALVYKAKCELLDRYVAVKILRDEYAEDDEFVDKFRMESQAAASLSHPNIVNIYDVGQDMVEGRKIHYIVMEYIKGETLKELIRNKGKLSIEETINYSIQIGKALQDAHRNNIIHRDIKPQNIMVDENNRIKVMDFGIARAATSSTIASSSEVLGSVHYFSPEQARGRYTDEKSDIYSLGIVMYEMITGKIPYSGQSPVTVALKHMQEDIVQPSKLRRDMPDDLEKVILKCVQKNQANRYRNTDELLSDLSKLARRHKVEMDVIPLANKKEVPVDPMRTQKIPRIDEEYKSPRKKPIRTNVKKKTEKKENIKVILFGVLMAFIVTSGVFFGINKIKGLGSGSEIIMPDLVGMDEEEAEKEILDLGLKFEVIKRTKDSELERGKIVSQETVEGTKLKRGFPVQVTVSDGQGYTKVPNLADMNIFDAEKVLRDAGLSMGRTNYEPSSSVELDKIIEQSIFPNKEVEMGTKIDVTVSQGSKSKDGDVSVPRVIGLTLEEARATLEKAGLKVGRASTDDSDSPKGRISWQSKASGMKVNKGEVIDLSISSGKSAEKPEEKPVEKEKPEDKPEEKPVEQEEHKTLTVNVEEDGAKVEVIRNQDGQNETVYSSTHDAGYVTIPVSGKDNASYSVYVNGVLK